LLRFICLFSLLFGVIFQTNATTSHEFRLKTMDGLSYIYGQIDLPSEVESQVRYPVVILQGGTEPNNRNYFSGENWFDGVNIVGELLNAGFAVVHYDSRGVYCSNSNCQRCDSVEPGVQEMLVYQAPLKNVLLTEADVDSLRKRNCIFSPESIQRTWENISEDLNVVYQFSKEQAYIDPGRITLIGHSEGGIHISLGIKKIL